jgi:hypothetical protein
MWNDDLGRYTGDKMNKTDKKVFIATVVVLSLIFIACLIRFFFWK